MIVSKETAHEIAEKLSRELPGPIVEIVTYPGRLAEVHHCPDGFDAGGWSRELAEQPLPVKVTRDGGGVSFVTGDYLMPLGSGDTVDFPAPGVAVISISVAYGGYTTLTLLAGDMVRSGARGQIEHEVPI